MAERRDLKLLQRNTPIVREAITDQDTGDPIDLTGYVIEFIIKATDTTDDEATGVIVLSTATGEITVTNAAGGICQVAVPAQQPGEYWRRLDIINGDDRKTAIYGPMHVAAV